MLRLFSVLMVSMSLVSCASLEEFHKEWVREHCVESAAYNRGMTDGLTPGTLPNSSYASGCGTNINELNTAYLKGFSQGIKARPQEININKNINVTQNGMRP